MTYLATSSIESSGTSSKLILTCISETCLFLYYFLFLIHLHFKVTQYIPFKVIKYETVIYTYSVHRRKLSLGVLIKSDLCQTSPERLRSVLAIIAPRCIYVPPDKLALLLGIIVADLIYK